MDRVETLIQKLQEQFEQGATAGQLLLTAQMLQHELVHLQSQTPDALKNVTVSMPVNNNLEEIKIETPKVEFVPVEEERIVQVLQLDEAEVEAELDEIKRNAALMQHMSGKSKPQLLFDMGEDEIPTLPRQEINAPKEINEIVNTENSSRNDNLKTPVIELSNKLAEGPIKDLKKAIGINDRFLYINELFRGDEVMYERSIKTINSFSIWPEAVYWIRRELKTKLGWIDSDATVIQFDQLIKKRFS